MNNSGNLFNATNTSVIPRQNFVSKYYQETVALKVFKLALQSTIALIGVLGNLLVCAVITKRANMKTTMNYYLRNLAIADLGVLLVNFPLAVIQEQQQYSFGRWFCLYVAPSTEMFFGASIWSITIVAIERYRNIIRRRSLSAGQHPPFRAVLWKIAAIWIASFIVVAVPLYPIMVYDPNRNVCYPRWPDYLGGNILMKAYALGLAICWYLLPLGIITFTYVHISRQLKQSTRFHKTMHGENSVKSQILLKEERQRLKQNRKAQRILTPLVLVFAVSMLPLNTFRLVQAFYAEFVFYKYYMVLLSVCAVFVIINSALDPVVYYIASKEFRQGLMKLLRLKPGDRDETTRSLFIKGIRNSFRNSSGKSENVEATKETEL